MLSTEDSNTERSIVSHAFTLISVPLWEWMYVIVYFRPLSIKCSCSIWNQRENAPLRHSYCQLGIEIKCVPTLISIMCMHPYDHIQCMWVVTVYRLWMFVFFLNGMHLLKTETKNIDLDGLYWFCNSELKKKQHSSSFLNVNSIQLGE